MVLSHNNPYFQCNIAITNFLVSHTCEIRFHDVIGESTNDVKAKILKHGCMTMFSNHKFYLIRWFQSCGKNNLTFVVCCDKMLLNSLAFSGIVLSEFAGKKMG